MLVSARTATLVPRAGLEPAHLAALVPETFQDSSNRQAFRSFPLRNTVQILDKFNQTVTNREALFVVRLGDFDTLYFGSY